MDDIKYIAPEVGGNESLIVEDTNTPEVSAFEAAKSGFRFWNTGTTEGIQDVVYNTFKQRNGFKPYESDQLKELDEDIKEKWAWKFAQTTDEVELFHAINDAKDWKRSLDIAEMDLKGAANNSAYFAGALAGLVADPTNLLAFGWAFKSIKTATTLGKIALTAAEGATVGLAATSLQGQLSQTTFAPSAEELKDWQIYGLVGGAIIGGAIGAVGKGIIHADMANDPVTKDLLKLNEFKAQEAAAVNKSIGAAEYAGEELQTGLLKPKNEPTSWLGKKIWDFTYHTVLGNLNPSYRVIANSKSREAQVTMRKLVGSALEFENLNQADQAAGSMQNAMVTEIVGDRTFYENNALKYYTKYVEKEALSGNKLSYDEWFTEVAKVTDNEGASQYASVNEFVANVHDPIFQKRWKQGQEQGMFDTEVQLDPTKHYRHRELDIDAMEFDRETAYNTFAQAIKNQRTIKDVKKLEELDVKIAKNKTDQLELNKLKAQYKGKKSNEKLAETLKKLDEKIAKLQQEELSLQNLRSPNDELIRLEAQEMVDRWIDSRYNAVKIRSNAVKNSQVYERLLTLDPRDISQYVKKDDIMGQFQRTTQEHYFQLKLREYLGTDDLNEISQKISNEYKPLIEEANKAGKLDEAASLTEKLKDDIETLTGVFNRLSGKSAQGEFRGGASYLTGKALTTITSLALGQSMAISQVPDAAVIAKKLASTEYAKDVQLLNKTLGSTAFKSIDRNTLVKIGLVAEDLDTRSVSLMDSTSGDLRDTTSNFGKFLSKAQSQIYKWNLMRAVNNGAKELAAPMAADNILASATRFIDGTATEKDIALFQMLGLKHKRLKGTPSDAELFINELTKNKIVKDGVTYANPDSWSSKTANKYYAAIREYVNAHLVVEPTAATKLLWFDTTLGQMIGQYKGFTLRALETHLVKSMQKRDAEALTIFLIRGILGSISYTAKAYALNKDDREVDVSPQRLIYEGLMRGGGLAGVDMFAGFMHQIGTATGLPTSIPTMLGIYDQKYANRGTDLVGQNVMGASYTLYKDTERSLKNLSNGKFTYQDWRHLEKYMPIYGAFYTQAILNQIR